ncbi:MAG TPA: cysteine--tRNA ligase, partial [Patescibacteria group bacterium]|nr:cysteine--tRNA ligase [Patescibacteria group bacterium]
MLKLYNTLSRKIENFKPLIPGKVGMYTCGPTVYDYTHIGHLRKYINDDILKKVLRANGFEVHHVMNITDVGHLTSDADSGDDKMEKGAKESGRTVWEVAKFFEDYFFKSVNTVNIERADIVCRATEHIGAQIKLIKALEKNGLTYQTLHAIYFDVTKFPNYGKLSGQKLEDKEAGARSDVFVDKSKKHPADFALWFFTVGHFKDHSMKWSSPWGEGFPGWHIECSAMSMEYLGESFDIHTGGIDHIPVHHENEIAQAEGATGKQFVKYWVHHDFVKIDKEKMSKSKKNFLKVDEIIEKGFDPIALRYLYLTGHYRSEMAFSFESLTGAQAALNKLREEIRSWPSFAEASAGKDFRSSDRPEGVVAQYWQKFLEAANDDLNIPKALAVVWEMVKSDIPTSEKSAALIEMDKILSLGLTELIGKKVEVPEEVKKLIEARENARKAKDFKKSDELRKEIKKLGYE